MFRPFSPKSRAFVAAAALTVAAFNCATVEVAFAQSAPVLDQYKPYAFLIGEWDFAPAGKASIGVLEFRWGPNNSYIWYDARTKNAKGELAPHFEGIIVWNSAHGNLDTLVMLDLEKGNAQEAGTFAVQPDGSVLRDIVVTGSRSIENPTVGGHFWNTFKADGPDRISASLRHETKDGWVANFPGSDTIVMTRRPQS